MLVLCAVDTVTLQENSCSSVSPMVFTKILYLKQYLFKYYFLESAGVPIIWLILAVRMDQRSFTERESCLCEVKENLMRI